MNLLPQRFNGNLLSKNIRLSVEDCASILRGGRFLPIKIMSRRRKSNGSVGCLVIGAAFIGWIGGCFTTDVTKKPSTASNQANTEALTFSERPTTPSKRLDDPPVEKAESPTFYARDGSTIRNVAFWHPKQVTLTKATKLRIEVSGKAQGNEVGPVGTELDLKGIDKDQLYVEFRGVTQKIPAANTDLAAQMAAVHVEP